MGFEFRRRFRPWEIRRSVARMNRDSLSGRLIGSWELLSRIDRTRSGDQREEPSLGSDPIAFLVFDAAGHFAAQFMKRNRAQPEKMVPGVGQNNSRAQGGYDAYFGTYTVEEGRGIVKTQLKGALSPENVGQEFTRVMRVEGDTLTIELDTTSPTGEALTRTLRWRRVSS
jgi:hypothetical protein